MNAQILAIYFFACCTWLIALLVQLKRNDALSHTFSIFCLFVTGWGIPITWQLNNDVSYETALLATRIGDGFALFIPPSWLHFVATYLEKDQKLKKWIFSIYLLSAVLVCFAPTSLYIPKLKPILDYKHYIHPGPIFHIFTIEFFLVVAYGFFELLKSLNVQTGVRRSQTIAFIAATSCGFLGGGLTFFLIYDIPFPQHAIFLMPLYPFIMAYAITRHGFLDPEEVLALHREKLALLGVMSSSINHEIKNPLFLIQETSRKALSDSESGKSGEVVNESLKKISTQVSRMTKLVERLQDFARPNPKKGEIEEIDLRQVIDSALFFANPELKYQNVKVDLTIPENLPKLNGDRSQFEVIFLNLIINAYHAMPNGGMLKIEAKSGSYQSPDTSVQIAITDTGTGIPKDQLKNIFKPFYTTKEKSGTGLGLYIVKTLVEQNKGKIDVASTLGKGTIFSLYFDK